MVSIAWDHSVDVLVVGSGNGGMTAALCAKQMGSDQVLVIEKCAQFGGTSSISGGGIWIPNNHYAQAAGAQDSLKEAAAYLDSTIPQGSVPPSLIDTYLHNAPKMLRFLHDHNPLIRYLSLAQYPDYYMSNPGAKAGHRSLEPEPINKSELGADWNKIRSTHHMMYMLDRIPLTQVEAHQMITNAPGSGWMLCKLFLKYLLDIPWRLRDKHDRRLTCGSAGVARLYLSLRQQGIPVWLDSPLKTLIADASGRISGVVISKEGRDYQIQARQAVILAAGGFEHNQGMREQFLPKPTDHNWSAGVPSNTGDTLLAALEHKAKTRLMNNAWWFTTLSVPGESAPRLSVMEKSLPGSCVVNPAGRRISNESQNYMAYQLEYFASHSDSSPNYPSYMIFDARFRKNYFVGPLLKSSLLPDWRLPKAYFTEGFLAIADSITELAKKVGIDEQGLETTIADLNEYARTGKDLEFNRGDSAYDRYYGDLSVKPNPCLAPIDQPPFYAMRIDPGDIGTQGGLEINAHAQVINENEEPIAGLYATGNCAAAILPTYPGPGATLGPAMTFAYQAAKHINQYTD